MTKKESLLETLIWQALELYPIDKIKQFLFDPDERVSFSAARRLQLNGGKMAYEIAKNMLQFKDVQSKMIGIFILGQLDSPRVSFREKTTPILLDILKKQDRKH